MNLTSDTGQSPGASPEYFITLREPGGFSRPGAFRGVNRADGDLRWHIRQSVRDVVDTPVRYLSNYPTDEELPDVLEHNDMLVVSQRFREAIEPWLKDYEFLPAEVERSETAAPDCIGGGPVVGDYWWLNSWRLLDLIDWDRSTLAPAVLPSAPTSRNRNSPLKVNHWERLYVDPALLRDEHFFGVKYVRGARRYVSPGLHEHLLKQRFRLRFGLHALVPVSEGLQVVIDRLNQEKSV